MVFMLGLVTKAAFLILDSGEREMLDGDLDLKLPVDE
jgi:hypothetical protein